MCSFCKKLLYNKITCSHHRGTGCGTQGAGQHCPVPSDTHSHPPVSWTQHPLCHQAQGQGDLRRPGVQQEAWRLHSSTG